MMKSQTAVNGTGLEPRSGVDRRGRILARRAAAGLGFEPADAVRLRRAQCGGFALIVVLIIITVLGILAGAFAMSMKVEYRLAANTNSDSEMEWLGRSGVELARFVLANSGGGPGPGVTSLNQIWAGGPGTENEIDSALAGISLKDNRLGDGFFSVEIVDLERFWNINTADEELLERAFMVMQMQAADLRTITDSILDWRDSDDAPRLSGTESDFYLSMRPPYLPKNGPIDDLAELMLIRGITPEVFWGPEARWHRDQLLGAGGFLPQDAEPPSYPVGLKDLFTALSIGRVNLNTASTHVLQMLPGIDANIAGNIASLRAGPDQADGTEDDTPYQTTAMVGMAVPGLDQGILSLYSRYLTVQSATYEVRVEAQIGNYRKEFRATILSAGGRDARVMTFSWD